MKKTMFLALSLFLSVSGAAYAHGGESMSSPTSTGAASVEHSIGKKMKSGLSVQVNGVELVSPANHQNAEGNVYVSVEAFAALFGDTYEMSNDQQSLSFHGKTITNIEVRQGIPTAWIRELAEAVGATQVSWDVELQQAYVLALPAGTIQLEKGVVPAMGEHWANPKQLPLGPIYGVYNGKLIFLEYMIAQKDFAEGKNHANIDGMKGVPMPSVVQSDVEFQPVGHPGFEIPHYDFHMYFISNEDQNQIGTQKFDLVDANGHKIGFAALMQLGPQLFLKVNAANLTPGSHGIHIHEKTFSGGDLKSSGGHFNPDQKKHGLQNPEGHHAGDLPNLVVEADGTVETMIPLVGYTLEAGKANSILGKSVIIHAKEDDGKTDPAGNSGDRAAGASFGN